MRKRGNAQIFLVYVIGLPVCALSFILVSPMLSQIASLGYSFIPATSTFYQVLLFFEAVIRYYAVCLLLNATIWAFHMSNLDQEVLVR